jgi:acetolactate synthase-1/2/3 large subunit
MGKGAVSMDDQHCLYTMGLGSGDYNNLAFDDADLVISCGYDLVEYSPSAWNRTKQDSKKIIHIDFWEAEVDKDYQPDVEIVGDLADALWQLNEAINKEFGEKLPIFDINSRSELRNTLTEDFAAEKDDTSVPVKPQKILWDVREVLGADDILLSDVGAHKMWISRYFQCLEPNTCLISNGFCTMGFAMPGSIGAKIAFPDRRVLSISGDAGFMMNVQDLETAVRRKLNIVAMIWEDGEYGLIKWKQQNGFNGQHSDLSFGNPDFESLAKSFGMWGKKSNGNRSDSSIPRGGILTAWASINICPG